jgi:hypothetical protein
LAVPFCIVRGVALASAEWMGWHSVGQIEGFVVLLVAAAVVVVVARLDRLPFALAL